MLNRETTLQAGGSTGGPTATAPPTQNQPPPQPPDRQPVRLVGQAVCPHCWERFEPTNILWVARHEDHRGDPYLSADEMMRFRPSRFTPDGNAIDPAGMVCHELACPQCHLIVPRRLLENRQATFSLVGVPGSGKSYLLASMAWQLRRLLPQRFGLRFADVDPRLNAIINDYEETLFLQEDPDRPVYIDKTQLHGSHYDQVRLKGQPTLLAHPFLFSIDAPDDAPEAARVLCFYDNAGEHFYAGGDTTLAPGSRHVALADTLMFLFDPLQDARFRERCRAFSNDPQLQLSSRAQRQDTVLTEAAERVRRYAGLSPRLKLSQPMIVLVGKADVWCRELVGEDLDAEPFVGDAPAKVDAARIERVSVAVRAMLESLTPEFVAAAEGHYERVLYVPVSALGGSPQPLEGGGLLTVRPRELRPKWVAVPVLYALARWLKGPVWSGQA